MYSAKRHPVRKLLLGGKANDCLRLGLGCGYLSTEHMEPSRDTQGISQTKRMSNFLSQRETPLALLKGLVWIAQMPQGQGGVRVATHPRIRPIQEGMRAVLLRIIERNHLRHALTSFGQLT